MSDVGPAQDRADFLGRFPPFDTLDRFALLSLAEAGREVGYARGDVVLNAFVAAGAEMGVVLDGRVALWTAPDRGSGKADQRLGPGGAFGFSAMLSGEAVGPRVVAVTASTVVWLPEQVVLPAFTSPGGVRYLATEATAVRVRTAAAPSFSLVEELVTRTPLLLPPSATVAEAARAMTEAGNDYAAVRLGPGRYGLVTDRLLRTAVLQTDRPGRVAVADVLDPNPPTVQVGDSAAEAMIALLDRQADVVLVLDRAGELRGAAGPRDLALSPTTAGVALHEQLRHAHSRATLVERAARMPEVTGELLSRGLTSSRVVAVHSSLVDATVRRALQLVFADHPELDLDRLTWLSLGSNGRREAAPSSDVDSAVSLVDPGDGRPWTAEEVEAYRRAFAEVIAVLGEAGLRRDVHGASADRRAFTRTSHEWRQAAQSWLADPVKAQGAMMTSLLVDGRPIHGDPGLTEVNLVFADLRGHPGTMRLLLAESLARRARQRSIRDVLARRRDTFDLKAHALLPIVNVARWAALAVGSPLLSTVERLRAAAGSTMLPEAQVERLVEVFEVLQRLRLEWQLHQIGAGEPPTDVVALAELSPLDRSVVAQAVREISAVQRRMDNVAQVVPPAQWGKREPS